MTTTTLQALERIAAEQGETPATILTEADCPSEQEEPRNERQAQAWADEDALEAQAEQEMAALAASNPFATPHQLAMAEDQRRTSVGAHPLFLEAQLFVDELEVDQEHEKARHVLSAMVHHFMLTGTVEQLNAFGAEFDSYATN